MESREDEQMSASELNFKAKVQRIKTDFTNLLELAGKIGSLEKGDRQRISDGSSVGRREFKQYKSLCFKQLDGLVKDYNQSKKQPKSKRTGGSNGFRNPMVVSKELYGYFNDTNLGPAYEKIKNDDGTFTFKRLDHNLKDYLPLFLENGVTSSALLTPLFSISAKSYDMQLEGNRQYLKATDIMKKHFSAFFELLRIRDEEAIQQRKNEIKKLESEGVSEDKLKELRAILKKSEEEKFNPEKFKYARLQSLVSLCRRKERDTFNKTQIDLIEDPAIKDKLFNEQKVVSDTLAYFRQEGKKGPKDVVEVPKPAPVQTPTPAPAPVQTPTPAPLKAPATRPLRIPSKK